MDKPGQEVKNFGKNMAEMACPISGTGSDPIDISTLVVTSFINCEVLAFQVKDTGLYDFVYSKPKALSIDNIIWTLKKNLFSQGPRPV